MSRPVVASGLAIPDLAALIISAYCKGIRIDFHAPAWVTAAKSISRAAKFWVVPTYPLAFSTNLAGTPIHCATRLKILATLTAYSGHRDVSAHAPKGV
jgi:hypothetical protein